MMAKRTESGTQSSKDEVPGEPEIFRLWQGLRQRRAALVDRHRTWVEFRDKQRAGWMRLDECAVCCELDCDGGASCVAAVPSRELLDIRVARERSRKRSEALIQGHITKLRARIGFLDRKVLQRRMGLGELRKLLAEAEGAERVVTVAAIEAWLREPDNWLKRDLAEQSIVSMRWPDQSPVPVESLAAKLAEQRKLSRREGWGKTGKRAKIASQILTLALES